MDVFREYFHAYNVKIGGHGVTLSDAFIRLEENSFSPIYQDGNRATANIWHDEVYELGGKVEEDEGVSDLGPADERVSNLGPLKLVKGFLQVNL